MNRRFLYYRKNVAGFYVIAKVLQVPYPKASLGRAEFRVRVFAEVQAWFRVTMGNYTELGTLAKMKIKHDLQVPLSKG